MFAPLMILACSAIKYLAISSLIPVDEVENKDFFVFELVSIDLPLSEIKHDS